MSRLLRVLAVGLTAAACATTMDVPAYAAASACTHHFSGPQVCTSTDGEAGSENPGRVTTAWTNPPRNKQTATVHITEPSGQRYTLTARRSRGQLVAVFTPSALPDGKLYRP